MWQYLLLLIAVEIFLIIISSLRYRVMLGYIKERISLFHAFLVHQISQFSTLVVPFKLGPTVTKPLATKYLSRIPAKNSLPVVMFEQFMDIGWQILMLPLLLIFIGEEKVIGNMAIQFTLLFLLIALAVVLYKKRGYVLPRAWRFLPKRIQRMGTRHGITPENARHIIEKGIKCFSTPGSLLKISILTLIIIFVSPIIPQISGLVFSVYIEYKVIFLAHWASFIIGRFSGIPSGLGTLDLSMVGILVLFSVDPIAAAQIVVLQRILWLLFVVILGGGLFFHVSRGYVSRRRAE